MDGALPLLLALPQSFLEGRVLGLLGVAGGYLLQVLEAVLDLHNLALVPEVLLVSDEDAVGIITLIVCLDKNVQLKYL